MKDTKNNFTQLPNELITVLLNRELTKNEARILLFVARKTYGYHRDTDRISRREFNVSLGISLRHITEIQERLLAVGFLELLNKGNSVLNSSEWKISLSDAENKLEKLSKIDRRSPDWQQATGDPRVPRYPKVTSYPKVIQLGTHAVPTTVPVNKGLNKDDAIKEILTLKGDHASVKNGRLFVKGKIVNSPVDYLKAIKKNEQPTNTSTPLKTARQLTDNEIREHLGGKVAGRDEGIDQDVLYEALERGLYSA